MKDLVSLILGLAGLYVLSKAIKAQPMNVQAAPAMQLTSGGYPAPGASNRGRVDPRAAKSSSTWTPTQVIDGIKAGSNVITTISGLFRNGQNPGSYAAPESSLQTNPFTDGQGVPNFGIGYNDYQDASLPDLSGQAATESNLAQDLLNQGASLEDIVLF